MRRSTVLSLPPQLVFPGLSCAVGNERENGKKQNSRSNRTYRFSYIVPYILSQAYFGL